MYTSMYFGIQVDVLWHSATLDHPGQLPGLSVVPKLFAVVPLLLGLRLPRLPRSQAHVGSSSWSPQRASSSERLSRHSQCPRRRRYLLQHHRHRHFYPQAEWRWSVLPVAHDFNIISSSMSMKTPELYSHHNSLSSPTCTHSVFDVLLCDTKRGCYCCI